jgi:hypothetical protein
MGKVLLTARTREVDARRRGRCPRGANLNRHGLRRLFRTARPSAKLARGHPVNRKLSALYCILALLTLNVWLSARLFRTEFTPFMYSIEGSYVGLARWLAMNWAQPGWFPLFWMLWSTGLRGVVFLQVPLGAGKPLPSETTGPRDDGNLRHTPTAARSPLSPLDRPAQIPVNCPSRARPSSIFQSKNDPEMRDRF